MFKIGDTSGLVEAKCDTKKSPIKVVGDIVEDMAKKCCHVPKKMRAPSKLVEVTNGCFSSAQVISVSDELSGSSSDEDGDNSDAASDAASTGGGCGGGRTSQKPVQPSSGSCGKKSSNGGDPKKVQDACTGTKLSNMVVPKTIDDFLGSDYSDKLKQEQEVENDFRNKYCVLEPYPECKTCPYRVKNLETQPKDLNAVFDQLKTAIKTLQEGNYSLATKMFECPGQAHDLMTGEFRTMAEAAVPNAVAVLMDLTAARGALDAFDGLATAAEYTDFRREVLADVDKLFKSGAKIGIPKAFTDEIGEILTKLGCSPNHLVRLSATPLSSRDTRYGKNYDTRGSRCRGRNPVDTPYKSEARRMPSPESIIKAEAALADVRPALEKASALEEIIPVESPTTASSTESITTNNNANVPIAPALTLKPTSLSLPVSPTTDKVAKAGKTYMVEVIDSPTTSDTESSNTGISRRYIPVPIPITRGDDLEPVAAKYGRLFEVDKNGLFSNPVKTQPSATITGDKRYVKKLSSGDFAPVEVYPGEIIPESESEDLFEIPRETNRLVSKELIVQPDDDVNIVVIPTETYLKLDETTGKFVKLEDTSNVPYNSTVHLPSGTYRVVSSVPKPQETPGKISSASQYTGSELCVLDNGIIVADPITADAASLLMTIDTKSLVTKTGVRAGDMSTIKGLGLSPYEVKMAYILDHESNQSVMPEDVVGVRIPTILDEIEDMD